MINVYFINGNVMKFDAITAEIKIIRKKEILVIYNTLNRIVGQFDMNSILGWAHDYWEIKPESED